MKRYSISAMDNCNGKGFYEEVETWEEAARLAHLLFGQVDEDGERTWSGVHIRDGHMI